MASTRAVVLALLVVGPPGSAAAQGDGATTGFSMDFPERASALRPTGMTAVRGSWVRRFAPEGNILWDDGEFIHADFTMQELEARLPIGDIVLEAAAGSTQRIYSRHRSDDRGVWVDPNAPQVGVYFVDALDPHWRYELGGALVLGIDERVTADDACLQTYTHCYRPMVFFDDTGTESLGWDVHRRTRDAVVFVSRARVEWIPVARLVIGAELELPVYLDHDGRGIAFYPQGAVELAYRLGGATLVGLRARLTSQAPILGGVMPRVGYEPNVTFEPYLRLAFLERDWGGFVRATPLLSVGPAYPTVFDSSSRHRGWTGGFSGAQLDVGVLY